MTANLPHLELIPLDSLVIHERHDEQRTLPLLTRIQESGIWRNPPIVSPLLDSSGRYMVLDGANRITVLRKIDCPHAVVQVVEPDDPGLKLYNWNHVVWGWKPVDFITAIRRVKGINLIEDGVSLPDFWGEDGIAMIQLPEGDLYTIKTAVESLINRVEILNAVVDSYKARANLDRTNEWSVVRLKAAYPELSGLVIFPHFEIQHVLRLAGDGCLLPTGITRFMVSPRVLHLNYPLAAMAAKKPLAEKNVQLQTFIQKRIAEKRVRYYAESTYLFDE
jgi:hypothetical protein